MQSKGPRQAYILEGFSRPALLFPLGHDMSRSLTIPITTVCEALDEFRDAFRGAQAGHRRARRAGVSLTSIEAARALLTPARLALLRAIRARRPRSVAALARMVRRDPGRVEQDVQRLAVVGLVRIADGALSAPFDEIRLQIRL